MFSDKYSKELEEHAKLYCQIPEADAAGKQWESKNKKTSLWSRIHAIEKVLYASHPRRSPVAVQRLRRILKQNYSIRECLEYIRKLAKQKLMSVKETIELMYLEEIRYMAFIQVLNSQNVVDYTHLEALKRRMKKDRNFADLVVDAETELGVGACIDLYEDQKRQWKRRKEWKNKKFTFPNDLGKMSEEDAYQMGMNFDNGSEICPF